MNLIFKRISLRFLSFCVIFCALFSACGCSGGGAGKVLGFSLATAPENLDPQTASNSSAITIVNNIFEGLYRRTPDNKFELGAAKKVDISQDGKTYTYTIKDDLSWKYYNSESKMEDGTVVDFKVTADDFLFAFQRLMDPDVQTPYSSNYYFIKNAKSVKEGRKPPSSLGVRVNNQGQLIIEIERKTPLMEELLSSAPAMPCNREFFSLTRGRYGVKGSMLLSNGPYYVHMWQNTDDARKVRLKANEKYYDRDKISILGINLTVRGKTEAFELYRKNDIDTAIIGYNQFKSAKVPQNLTKPFQNSVVGIGLNQSSKYFENEKIRKALAMAIDREQLQTLLREDQLIAWALVPNSVKIGSENYREAVGDFAVPAYNPEKAKDLLKQGISELKSAYGGASLNSVSILVDEEKYSALDQILQTWQKQLGIFMQIDAQPKENYLKKLKNGEFDCVLMTISSDSDTPSSILNKFSKESSFNHINANLSGYQEILNSASLQEDFESMSNKYLEAEKFVCYSGNFMPIYYQTEYFVWQNNLKDLIFDPGSKQLYYMYARKE